MDPAPQSSPVQSEPAVPGSFLSRHGVRALALVPLIFLLGVVAHEAVNVPHWDQWELVPLLDKTYHGELTLHDLWAQHNEHRILFPQIIMLGLARLTGWDIRYELAVNLLLALGIFAVFVHQIKITERKLAGSGLAWAIPAGSLVVFSLSQYQNWLWGWQLQMFLNLLAVLGGIVLLSGEAFSWRRFAAAAGLGFVATYSFANGNLFWPLGLVILLVGLAGKPERKGAVLAWILIGGLTEWTYFYHYHKPEDHPPLSLIFQMPLEYAAYVFKYIGSTCAQGVGGDPSTDGVFALIFGLAGTATLAWAAWMLVRNRVVDVRTLLPYFALCAYSVGSAMITGVGRLGFGSDQALASRYCTMETPFWVSLIVLLLLLARGEAKTGAAGSPIPPPGRRPFLRPDQTVAQWALRAAIIVLALGSVFGLVGAGHLSFQQAYGRARLLELAANPTGAIDADGLSLIYPRPEVIVERYPVLIQHRLSLFKHWNHSPDSRP